MFSLLIVALRMAIVVVVAVKVVVREVRTVVGVVVAVVPDTMVTMAITLRVVVVVVVDVVDVAAVEPVCIECPLSSFRLAAHFSFSFFVVCFLVFFLCDFKVQVQMTGEKVFSIMPSLAFS